jgi:DNA-binding transcriptional LysR family regulator
MQDLKDLECLVALARYRHFARAAAACGLSQPAFSMRIRGLEERLATRIVRRGNRFEGLTREGERVLAHAKAIIGEVRALEAEVKAARGEIVGTLAFGVIPTAAIQAADLAQRLHARHPRVRTSIVTTNSFGVQQGVEDGRFDFGITYTDGAAQDLLHVRPLYDERYSLLAPAAMAGTRERIPWAEAAALPLILLEPSMQNRRIVDSVFREIGEVPRVVSETSGFLPAVVMAARGMGATVIPDALHEGLGRIDGLRMLPLTEPDIAKSVSLVTSRRRAAIPAALALLDMLSEEAAP